MQKKRVLVIPGRITGGVGAVVMNLFRNIDRSLVAFDFCVSESDPGTYKDEIIDAGGRVFSVPLIKKVGPTRFIKEMSKVMRDNGPYDAVHIHSVHMGALALLAAKKAGIKKRIYHVHNTQDAALQGKPFYLYIEKVLNKVILKNATVRLACGFAAGKYIYGNNTFLVINNAIDLERFRPFPAPICDDTKRSLNIAGDKIIIGNVARFNPEKNQQFFLEFAEADKKGRNKILVLLIGDGDMKAKIEAEVNKRSLEDKIVFLGSRADVEYLYNIMDVFCLPSIFEGLPVTALEAQACGIPCLLSSSITDEADLNVSSYIQLPLSEAAEKWVKTAYDIVKTRNYDDNRIRAIISGRRYEISSICKEMEQIYLN